MTTDRSDGIGRGEVLRATLAASAAAATLLALYYLLPLQPPHGSPLVRTMVAVAIVIGVLVEEVRAILRHDRPFSRAVVSLAIVIPLFVVVFSWLYLTLSRSDPGAFAGPLTRTEALYFTVTILSTVGFGDIAPKTDQARLVVTTQMVADVILLAVAVRLIFTAAKRSTRARGRADPDD